MRSVRQRYIAEEAAREVIDKHDEDDLAYRRVRPISEYIHEVSVTRNIPRQDIEQSMRLLRPGWLS